LGVRFGVSGVSTTGDGRVNTVSGGIGATGAMIDSAVGNLISTGQPFPVAVPPLPSRLGVNLPVGGPSIAFAILGADYLVDLELSAQQVEGNAEIVSNPRVITADLKKATVLQGRQIPYSTVSDQGTNVEFKDAFLKLEVTPQITPDDRVRMDLKVSKDEQGATVATATGPQVSIDKREIETQVLVNNGETVVLGGVFEQTKGDNVTKVPLLGDMPLLGYLFRTTSKTATKRELLIFVTPQILKEGRVAE
jgi:type IV pilus assembly protein PilQ